MALPTRTLDQIVERTRAYLRTAFPGFPLGLKKFLGRWAMAAAKVAWGWQKALEDLDKDIVISARSSTDVLSDWGALLGLPDGEGGYGRKKPTAASGGVADLTGVKGTVYTAGLTATAEDGSTQIELTDTVTIPGSPPGFGTVEGNFVAITTGSVGNLPAGTVMTWDAEPAGADPTFTLTSALGDGEDDETNAALFARIVTRLQTPPRGGTAEDIREWATTTGISEVFVYPRRGGTGTADAVLTTGGTGQGRRPSAAQLAEAQESIDENRPVASEQITAIAPYMPDDSGHLIKVRVIPAKSDFDFDWDDAGIPMVVDTGGYDVGPPATITVTGALPASLTDAIDAYLAGTREAPRLQVLSTGSVINEPIRAVDYSGSTIELETVPATWVSPSDGDQIYAYGPVVATISAGLLALVDSLGPSRESGYGDELTPWRDTLSISGIIAVAENAIDTDGTELIEKVPVGQATIDGFAGDVTPGDTGVTAESPEMLYASHIAVTG